MEEASRELNAAGRLETPLGVINSAYRSSTRSLSLSVSSSLPLRSLSLSLSTASYSLILLQFGVTLLIIYYGTPIIFLCPPTQLMNDAGI